MENNTLPLVSICVPVYNGAQFIGEALESIRNQIYTNFECHIINNASNDGTQQVAEEFQKKDPRFFVHTYTDFVDITANWNRTVHHISPKAKYFKVVQADDVIFAESVNTMVDLMEKYPQAGIGSSYRLVGKTVYGSGMDYFKGNLVSGMEILRLHLMDKAEITGSVTQLFFRVETLKKVPDYPLIFSSDDLHFDTRLAYEMFLISDLVFSFSILNLTRRHENATTITTVEKFNTLLHAKETRLHRFKQYFPEIEERYKNVRRNYAYFFLKNRLMLKNECIDWHQKRLKRNFSLNEYLTGALMENRFGAKISKALSHPVNGFK
jgi:glycosyltransferase involved in cell wall biosynthesis